MPSDQNQMVRDEGLAAVGLDPQNPSGPPPMAPLEPPPERARSNAPPISSKATRMTSLAAGIITGNEATPPPPEGGGGGSTAPVNTAVPQVTQSGTTLSCTQGEWTSEPTSYAYAWQVNSVGVGTDAATYDVQPADVGQSATCTVTATNAAGSAAAPPSVGVVVA
jgi:hypothetical protein